MPHDGTHVLSRKDRAFHAQIPKTVIGKLGDKGLFPARTQDIRRLGRAQIRRIKIPLSVQHLRKRKDELSVKRSVRFHFRHARDILPEIVYALAVRRCEHAHRRDTLDIAHIFALLRNKPVLWIGNGARRERLPRREKIVLLSVIDIR